MQKQHYSKGEVLRYSRLLIHAFMNRRMGDFADMLAEDFVWVGDYASLYIKGKEAFLKTVVVEETLPPVQVAEEEYSLLVHERRTWVTYGRMRVIPPEDQQESVSTRIHFTFVWEQVGNDLMLIYANACHVQEDPQDTAAPVTQSRVFSSGNGTETRALEKICIKDTAGNTHFYDSDEIIYIAVEDKLCTVVTQQETLTARIALRQLDQPPLMRIHQSFLVNPAYVVRLRRYEAELRDGRTLPVGRKYYDAVRSGLSRGIL
jgi:hypothetical protein